VVEIKMAVETEEASKSTYIDNKPSYSNQLAVFVRTQNPVDDLS
jgi:hypothetical protein